LSDQVIAATTFDRTCSAPGVANRGAVWSQIQLSDASNSRTITNLHRWALVESSRILEGG